MIKIYKKANFNNGCPVIIYIILFLMIQSEKLIEIVAKEALQQQNHRDIRWIGNTYNISDLNSTYCNGTKEVLKINSKMLVIHGGKDRTVELKYSERLKGWLPNCTLKIVENAGHCNYFLLIILLLQYSLPSQKELRKKLLVILNSFQKICHIIVNEKEELYKLFKCTLKKYIKML